MNNMKKSLLCLLLAVILLATSILPALAEDIPYDTYNYDYWNDIFRTPAAYEPAGTLLGTDLTWNGKSLGAFGAPEDMFVAPDGSIYIADTNNHRIVVLSGDLKQVLNIIDSFDNQGMKDGFNKPTGVAVTVREVEMEDESWVKKTFIHIADSMNRRIVVLDDAGVLQQIIEMPAQAQSQTNGSVTYEVGTYIEGMDQNAGTIYRAESGDVYAAVNLPEGSAAEVTDENGLVYTVVAVSDVLEPMENELIVGAKVTGSKADNADAAALASFAVKNGQDVQQYSGSALTVTDAAGNAKASGLIEIRDASGAAAGYALRNEEGVLLMDAAQLPVAYIAADGSVTLSDEDAEKLNGLKWADGKAVFAQDSGEAIAAVLQNGTAIHDAKGNVLAVLEKNADAALLRDAQGAEIALLNADGSMTLRDADGNVLCLLTRSGTDVTLHDAAGAGYAVIDKSGNVTLLGADGKTAGFAFDGKGVEYILPTGETAAAVKTEDGVCLLNAKGDALAALKAENDVTLLLGASSKELAALHQDGTIHLRDKDGADIAVITAGESGLTVQNPDGSEYAHVAADDSGTVVNNEKNKEIVAFNADNALVIKDSKKNEAALLTLTADGFAVTAAESGVTLLLAADGSITYQDAQGTVFASVSGDVLTALDAEGGVIAQGRTTGELLFGGLTMMNDPKAGKTVTNADGVVLASLQKNGSVTILNAEGEKAGAVTMDGGHFNIENDKAKDLAAVTAAGTVSCVDSKGKEIAFVDTDGSISVREGGKEKLRSTADSIVFGGVTVAQNGNVSFAGADGAAYASLRFGKDAAYIKDAAGAETALLTRKAGVIALQDVMKHVKAGDLLNLTQADGSILTVTMKSGVNAYIAAADGKGFSRIPAGGEETSFSKYDPVPKKDIFMLIGRLVTGPKTTGMTNIRSMWVDGDGSVYAVSDKSATKLDSKGKLHRAFASYKDETGKQVTFTNITEFAVSGGNLYLRDGANKIVVLDQEGDLVRVIASNAVEIRDADGNVTATLDGYTAGGEEAAFSGITGLMLVDDLLLVGQSSGKVAVLDKQGAYIDTIDNETVLRIAGGQITDKMTSAVVGKVSESFSGLSGVSMKDGQLCVLYGDKRIAVLSEGKAEIVRQKNAVIVREGESVSYITGYQTADGFSEFASIGGVEGVGLNYISDVSAPPAQRVKRQLCVADNKDQMIVFAADGTLLRAVKDADSEVLEEGYVFTPKKVAVDYAGRVYCIAEHMFEGIMVFETNGDFTGFFGTIEVTISAWDKFWRKLATKEERSKQQLFIPTEFTGIDIDEEGFVYASNVDSTGLQAVRRLNPKGEDVIRMGLNANLGGDIAIDGMSDYAGPSMIRDVVYRDKGVYSLLDTKRGRIFTYDHEGNLLYIFGGLGTTTGTLNQPVAIEFVGDRLMVLDSVQNSILIFKETNYGTLINEAVALRFDGDETKAIEKWEKVLELDENNELANTGIGKAYLSAGENRKAMTYLKRGMNREYYSVAFKRYRNELLEKNIPYVLTGVVVLAIGLTVYLKVIRPRLQARRGSKKDEYGATFAKSKLGHLFYTVFHPGDGYYWIRHREMGSVWLALLLVLLFGLAFSLNRLFASFVVSDVNVRSVNLLPELAGVLLMYILLCVGNWSITCLMDGEGRFKDICIAIGYALLPMIVTYALATVVSQFLADGEQAFYGIIMGIGIAYTLIMVLTGIMQVHNYTLGKTLLTLLLTLVAMLIVIFLVLLVTNFIGQVLTFFKSIYTELIFRF